MYEKEKLLMLYNRFTWLRYHLLQSKAGASISVSSMQSFKFLKFNENLFVLHAIEKMFSVAQ